MTTHEDSFAELRPLGWSARWQDLYEEALVEHGEAHGMEPGRVVAGDRELLRVATTRGDEEALLPGRLLYRAASPAELPCVGDWLLLRRPAAPDASGGGAPLLAEAVLPRRTLLVRRAAGRRSEPQALAANLDVALLVAALDGDWSPRRLERWLLLVRESGAEPVVVLTKRDLCADVDAAVAATRQVAGAAVPVLAVDARAAGAVEALAPWLAPGATLALLGSSGVGKSTLANRLAGREVAATSAVAGDGRGRHTTTRRALLPLPGGALLLDTPGVREVGAWLGGEEPAALFPEIAALAARCRFRDCTHGDEPGCAVRAAAEAGELDGGRLASLHRLLAERAALERRTDEGAARAERQRWKAIHRAARRYKPRVL